MCVAAGNNKASQRFRVVIGGSEMVMEELSLEVEG